MFLFFEGIHKWQHWITAVTLYYIKVEDWKICPTHFFILKSLTQSLFETCGKMNRKIESSQDSVDQISPISTQKYNQWVIKSSWAMQIYTSYWKYCLIFTPAFPSLLFATLLCWHFFFLFFFRSVFCNHCLHGLLSILFPFLSEFPCDSLYFQ